MEEAPRKTWNLPSATSAIMSSRRRRFRIWSRSRPTPYQRELNIVVVVCMLVPLKQLVQLSVLYISCKRVDTRPNPKLDV